MAGDKKNKIAIVGGGMQGLSVAYFLSENTNNSVTVFERQNNLGGLLGLLEVNGTPLEGAYHHWFNHDVDIINLAKELGLKGRLFYRESKMGLLYDGVIYPFGTPFDLLRFSPLSFLSRLRVGLCIAYLRFFKDYKRFENIPIIIMTASHNAEVMYRETGADDYIQKPYEIQELLAKVQRLLQEIK